MVQGNGSPATVEGPALGNHGNSCAVAGQGWSRGDALALREVLWGVSSIPDVTKCGRVPCSHQMLVRRHGSGYRLGGLCRCHSVWVCPICSTEIRASRGEEIGLALELHLAEGRGVAFGSATVPHGFSDRLRDTYSVVAKAWASVNRDYSVRAFRDAHDWWGFVRTVEVTYRTGWHPHVHWLDFWEGTLSAGELVEYRAVVYRAWSRAVVRLGFGLPSVQNGVRILPVVDGAAMGEYMTDMAPSSAGHELTSLSTKTARMSGRGPFDILREVQAGNVEPWLALWHEYERGTRGRRMLGASHGLLARLGIGADDPELPEGGEVVGVVQSDHWGHARFYGRGLSGMQAAIEAAACRGQAGIDEVVAWFCGYEALPVQMELVPELGPGDDGGMF